MNFFMIHMGSVLLLALFSLSACGGGGKSSGEGVSNTNTQNTNVQDNLTSNSASTQAKKVVFVFQGVKAKSCSGTKLRSLLENNITAQGFSLKNYTPQAVSTPTDCHGFGKNCEKVVVNEEGAGENESCVIKLDLPYEKAQLDPSFSSKKKVLLFKKISRSSCEGSEIKDELKGLFAKNAYTVTDIVTKPVSGNFNCNPYLENECQILQGEDETASDSDQCLLGFNMPVSGGPGGPSDTFMKRDVVFIYTHVKNTTCQSQMLIDGVKDAFKQNSFSATDIITKPIAAEQGCNAYKTKGCGAISGREDGALEGDRCLVRVNLKRLQKSVTDQLQDIASENMKFQLAKMQIEHEMALSRAMTDTANMVSCNISPTCRMETVVNPYFY